MKYEERVYRVVEAEEIDRVIRAEYGVSDYSFVRDVEADQPSEHAGYVYGTGVLSQYDHQRIAAFRSGGEYDSWLMYPLLMEDMAARGLVEPGHYLIMVGEYDDVL